MGNLEFKQITEIDNENLEIMTNWMYNWWGNEEGYIQRLYKLELGV